MRLGCSGSKQIYLGNFCMDILMWTCIGLGLVALYGLMALAVNGFNWHLVVKQQRAILFKEKRAVRLILVGWALVLAVFAGLMWLGPQ